MLAFILQTDPTSLTSLLDSYGLIGIIVYLFFREVVPWMRETFSERYRNEQEHKKAVETQKLEQDARLTKALERFSEQMHTFGLALTAIAERLSTIERDQEAMGRDLSILSDRRTRQRDYTDERKTTQPPRNE